MKKILISLFIALFAFGITAYADGEMTITFQSDNPVMTVNGERRNIDDNGTSPFIIDGRTLLPVRAFVEAIGGTAEWDGNSRTATLAYKDNVIKLTIDSTTAYLNNEPRTLDVIPVIISGRTMLPIRFVAESFGYGVYWNGAARSVIITNTGSPNGGIIIVLDPGHGKDSGLMSAEEKEQSGWVYNSDRGGWGEWRHFKYGTSGSDCWGDGCSHRVTQGGGCWYPIGNGDRDTEPEINMNNCLAAKSYLEQMGYKVRLARSSNDENPSITRRLTYCYPGNDTTMQPDASVFVCVHSNAGGGRGSSYISLAGPYDQPTQSGSSEAYTTAGNALGWYINERIGSMTPLRKNSPITFEPELIAFCKAPVVCGYMEIGFFDNPSDLDILYSSSDAIGHAIAAGIDDYLRCDVVI